MDTAYLCFVMSGTGWKDLHSWRDLNCWGQNDLEAAFIKCVCCLAEVLESGILSACGVGCPEWLRGSRTERDFPGTQLQLCGCVAKAMWHYFATL